MKTFEELGVRADICGSLTALGFEEPTPVQEQVIPILLDRQQDMICLAQTGTGKTAAFGIPLLQLVDSARNEIQALVLCPTRELCVQVARDMDTFITSPARPGIVPVYGGARIDQQITKIRRGARVIVATPGRLHDLIRRNEVKLGAIRLLVLDEADEMLQMGFKDELDAILAQTPAEKSSLLFSATMSKEVARISKNYMEKPLEITVGSRNVGGENIRHCCYTVQARDRYAALKRLVDINPDIYGIVFCRTREETRQVAEKLAGDGYGAEALHGELSQVQRDHVMNRFRTKNIQLLVATDVAARGLDVSDLTHVINYNLPDDPATYTHRSGRTGRAGKQGISVALINLREHFKIRAIEHRIRRTFEQCKIPSGHEVCERRLLHLVETMEKAQVDHARIDPFLPEIMKKLEGLDREELIRRIVSMEFNRFLEYYRNAPELNVSTKGGASRGRGAERYERRPYQGKGKFEKNARPGAGKGKFDRNERSGKGKFDRESQGEVSFSRFSLSVGKNDGINAQRLIAEINATNPGLRIKVGRIDIKNSATTVEADSRFDTQVLASFKQLRINGKPVDVEGSRAPKAAAPKPARKVAATRHKKQDARAQGRRTGQRRIVKK
ncbi:MAG: DEAD/DEAH box helicase [Desulfobulbaceae bacterium]|uniref:DEAD/DEAH box helicase n=1 Tax=Candidatus Desulfatifera sulfidica TaxID=2841691 RepID=A0A8J6T9S3_9BACT|nr:DEAD/DEAH box helicase [Candidatus Desulfatifera sulfidica]